MFANVELIIVIFLGIVSVATAYTSFQSASTAGRATTRSRRARQVRTAAESLYLEGNQQYIQDAQTVLRLAELNTDTQSADPVVATAQPQVRRDLLHRGIKDLDAAIPSAAA